MRSEPKQIESKPRGRPRGAGVHYRKGALDPRRLLFIGAYVSTPNRSLAEMAREAGFAQGANDNTMRKFAWKLYNEPLVQLEIRRRQEISAKRRGLTLERHLEELAKIGHSDIRDFVDVFNAKDPIEALRAMPDEITAAVKSIKVKEIDGGRTTELALWDKNDALKALAGHLGMRRPVGFYGPDMNQRQIDGGQRQTTMRAMLRCLSPKQLAAWRDIVETLEAAAKTQGQGGQMIEHEPEDNDGGEDNG